MVSVHSSTESSGGSAMSARDDAVTKVAAFLQLAVGYAIQGSYLSDNFAKTHAEPVVDAILAAVAADTAEGSRS